MDYREVGSWTAAAAAFFAFMGFTGSGGDIRYAVLGAAVGAAFYGVIFLLMEFVDYRARKRLPPYVSRKGDE